MGANNPGMIAYQEVHRMHGHPPALFVSIGTGLKRNIPKRKKRDQARELLMGDRTDEVPRKQFLKKYLELSRFMKDFASDTEAIANGIKFAAERDKIPHRRFNVSDGLGTIPIDDWRPARSGELTIAEIVRYTDAYLEDESVQEDLGFCARQLVDRRRRRAMTERWETFATDIGYQCPATSCPRGVTLRFRVREELRKHCTHSHPEISADDVEAFLDTRRILRIPKLKKEETTTKGFEKTAEVEVSNGHAS
jgi:hypothetical protein